MRATNLNRHSDLDVWHLLDVQFEIYFTGVKSVFMSPFKGNDKVLLNIYLQNIM